ncbi:MAG TPA: transposase [Caulobacteraceae bacterium]|jgi:putative transposase
MARLARVVVPGEAHYVTQQGNRREPVFFGDDDYRAYLALVAAAARRSGTAIWSYCLMPGQVRFIMVPGDEDGLRATFAEAHRRYTARIHAREGWNGHLWQGRFASTPMDGPHLMEAARHVALTPVQAGLVAQAGDWPWSSARAHLAGQDDGVVTTAPVLAMAGDFAAWLDAPQDEGRMQAIRRSRTTGRPVGEAAWLAHLEARLGRPLAAGKPGRRAKPRSSVEPAK